VKKTTPPAKTPFPLIDESNHFHPARPKKQKLPSLSLSSLFLSFFLSFFFFFIDGKREESEVK
jgi:hypothetical protein